MHPTAFVSSPGTSNDFDAVDYGWYYNNSTFITQDPSTVFIGTFGEQATPNISCGYWVYPNINLAQGTQIWSAELYIDRYQHQLVGFAACTSPSSTPTSKRFNAFSCVFGTKARVKITAEDIDNASEYATVAQINAAARTTAITNNEYNVATNANADGAFCKQFESVVIADVTAQVQEVLDRPGWLSGNDMQFFLEDDGSDRLYDPDPNIGYNTWLNIRDLLGGPPFTMKLNITERV